MVVDQVSPRSDKTHISGELTLQQEQIGCHSKLSGTLERDMFQVCQSLETWPMIALESLLSRGYFLARLSLFVKSADMTFSYFGTCYTFNVYLTSIVWLLASLNSFFALWCLKSCSVSSATDVKGTLYYICCAYFHFHFFVFVVEEYICCFHIV